MKKWWKGLTNLDRYQLRMVANFIILWGIGYWTESVFILACAAITLWIPLLLIEFSRAFVLDWKKAYEDHQEALRKQAFFGGVQEPPSDGGAS